MLLTFDIEFLNLKQHMTYHDHRVKDIYELKLQKNLMFFHQFKKENE